MKTFHALNIFIRQLNQIKNSTIYINITILFLCFISLVAPPYLMFLHNSISSGCSSLSFRITSSLFSRAICQIHHSANVMVSFFPPPLPLILILIPDIPKGLSHHP